MTIEELEKQKVKVMNYIVYKKRTRQEVKNKFATIIPPVQLQEILIYLEQAGYLSDDDYIRRAVEEFMALKNLSLQEVKYKLYQRGIKRNDLEDYIANNEERLKQYELQSAKNLLLKRAKQEEIKSTVQYLRRKGYKEETIKEVIECNHY